jgi:hypothetical protein
MLERMATGLAAAGAGLLLPPLAVILSRQQVQIFRLDPVWIVIFLLLMGMVLWASTLVAGGKARSSYAVAHFPLHPAWSLLITMLCQGVLVALVGANVGWWTAQLPHELPVQTNILLLVAYFLAAFLLTISIARAISLPAAIAAGIFWVVSPIGAGDVGRRLATPAVFSYLTPPTVSWTNALLSALVGMLSFCLLLSSKRGLLPRRVLAVLLVAAVAIGYPLFIFSDWWVSRQNASFDEMHPFYSAQFSDANATNTDGSVEVRPASGETLHGPLVSLQLIDYRMQQGVTRTFPFPLQVLEIRGRSAWLLGRSGNRRLTLSRWDIADNSIRILLTLPARRGAFPSGFGDVASFSPDGHYAILCLPALQSHGIFNADLWLVDLTNRQTRLVMIRTIEWINLPAMHWEPGRAVNAEIGEQISLPAGAISPWVSPLAMEGRR